MPEDPTKNDILDKLKTWFTGGAMSVQGIYISQQQCASALFMLNRYMTEDSAESWKETCEEMRRIGIAQANEANDLINRLAAHIPDAFPEDREAVKEWNRVNGFD